jgi:outer membrane protein assembly factor BamD
MMKSKRLSRTALVAVAVPLFAVVVTLAGCKSKPLDDPIMQLAAKESLAQGKDLLAQKKFAKARPYFEHAYSVEPNSAIGREGLLLAADTYFQLGGFSNFVQAEAKYRDFLNRFPTSEQAGYVQFQIANSLSKRMERPDRDQAVTKKSLDAYEDLLRLYPSSEYAIEAKDQIVRVRTNLAAHEFVVARFYQRYGAPTAAIQRFEYLIEKYPEYPEKDKVLYNLGLSYSQLGKKEEAQKAFDQLKSEYPKSELVAGIPAPKAAK